MKRLKFALILLLFFSFASAKESDATLCKYDGTQQEMNACARHDYKLANAKLNKRYKELFSSLNVSKQDELRAQQKTWLSKTDAKCRLEAKDSEGGSIWPAEFFYCLELETRQRTKMLGK